MEKNNIFGENLLKKYSNIGVLIFQKYSKIEVIYEVKITVRSKSIPKLRIIPKLVFYCKKNNFSFTFQEEDDDDDEDAEEEDDEEDEEEEEEDDDDEIEEESVSEPIDERVPTPKNVKDDEDLDTDQETDRLLGQQYNDDNGYYDQKVGCFFCISIKYIYYFYIQYISRPYCIEVIYYSILYIVLSPFSSWREDRVKEKAWK